MRTSLQGLAVRPLEFVSDQGAEFLTQVIHELMQKHMIVHKKSTVYYPQANGQVESTNKILQNILKKIVAQHRQDWEMMLHSTLWAFRTTYKLATGFSPFRLVYGVKAVMPMEFAVPSLRIAVVAERYVLKSLNIAEFSRY